MHKQAKLHLLCCVQETVASQSPLLVKGMLGLLTLCPPEVAHLRKDLLIATRHILATDLRNRKCQLIVLDNIRTMYFRTIYINPYRYRRIIN